MLKLKISLSIFFTFCFVLSFSQKRKIVTIDIRNKGDIDTVFLTKKTGSQYSPFDTIVIPIGNNLIKRDYKLNEISFLMLKIKQKPGFYQFILDGDLRINCNVDSIWSSTIVGSKLTDDWFVFYKNVVQPTKFKIIKLNSDINKLSNPIDSLQIEKLLNEQTAVINENYKKTKLYIQKNRNSFVSLFLLESGYDKFGVIQNNILLNSLNIKLQNNSLGKFIREKINKDLQFVKGNAIPDFQIKDLLGETLSSKKIIGQITLLDFWGTWCGPCIKSLPKLKETYKNYKGSNLKFISIANENNINPDVFLPLIKKEEIEWKIYVQSLNDKSLNSLSTVLNITDYPTFILIGKDGVILERTVGVNGIDVINSFLLNYYK